MLVTVIRLFRNDTQYDPPHSTIGVNPTTGNLTTRVDWIPKVSDVRENTGKSLEDSTVFSIAYHRGLNQRVVVSCSDWGGKIFPLSAI